MKRHIPAILCCGMFCLMPANGAGPVQFDIKTSFTADNAGTNDFLSSLKFTFPLGIFYGHLRIPLSEPEHTEGNISVFLEPLEWLQVSGGSIKLRGSIQRLAKPAAGTSASPLTSRKTARAVNSIGSAGSGTDMRPFGAAVRIAPSFYTGVLLTPSFLFYGDENRRFAGSLGLEYQTKSMAGSLSLAMQSYRLGSASVPSSWFSSEYDPQPLYFPEKQYYSAGIETSAEFKWGGFFVGGGAAESPAGGFAGWLRTEGFVSVAPVHASVQFFWSPQPFYTADGSKVKKSANLSFSVKTRNILADGKFTLTAGASCALDIQGKTGKTAAGIGVGTDPVLVQLSCAFQGWTFSGSTGKANIPIRLKTAAVIGPVKLGITPAATLYLNENGDIRRSRCSGGISISALSHVPYRQIIPDIYFSTGFSRSREAFTDISVSMRCSWKIQLPYAVCTIRIQYTYKK